MEENSISTKWKKEALYKAGRDVIRSENYKIKIRLL
jgi:hypothetical protein